MKIYYFSYKIFTIKFFEYVMLWLIEFEISQIIFDWIGLTQRLIPNQQKLMARIFVDKALLHVTVVEEGFVQEQRFFSLFQVIKVKIKD